MTSNASRETSRGGRDLRWQAVALLACALGLLLQRWALGPRVSRLAAVSPGVAAWSDAANAAAITVLLVCAGLLWNVARRPRHHARDR